MDADPVRASPSEAGMRRSALATLIGLSIGGLPIEIGGAAAEDMALADFFGSWRGTAAEAEGLPGIRPEALNVTIHEDGAGFRMRWMTLASKPDRAGASREIEVSFDPTGQPGVFAYREEPGSLLDRLFASPASSNPLEGETLLWARLIGPSLTVYSLVIDDGGGFRLDRHERILKDGAMSYVGSRRTGDGHILSVQGRLEPAKG
jgi:hypothetical protein